MYLPILSIFSYYVYSHITLIFLNLRGPYQFELSSILESHLLFFLLYHIYSIKFTTFQQILVFIITYFLKQRRRKKCQICFNIRKKEIAYYTYDKFKKFISYEEDIRRRCVFEILYYCGLCKGELKSLTWKNIYFDKKVLSFNKQIIQRNNRVKFEFLDTKIKDSRRTVPITKVLLNDSKMLHEQDKKDYYGFNDDFFVVSDAKPITDYNI